MIDPNATINSHSDLPSHLVGIVDHFCSKKSDGSRYALGRNAQSAALDTTFGVVAFVDDFAPPGFVYRDKPVLKINDVPGDAIVVNCSTAVSPISAYRRLKGAGIAQVVNYCDLCRAMPNKIAFPDFVTDSREDLRLHFEKYQELEVSCADLESVCVLNDLACYRLTGDSMFMEKYCLRMDQQYFEDFISLDGSVFVDAGGFDGDTTYGLCNRCDTYKKIFFFEPSSTNLARAQIRLAAHRDIEFLPLALSDKIEMLPFDADLGPSSAVSEGSATIVPATTLDEQISVSVSLIKMDLEGWELRALQGARRHIIEDHPAMAIAAYHRPSDVWRIPEFVLGLRRDYDIRLRHYTEGWTETVLFFTPRPAD